MDTTHQQYMIALAEAGSITEAAKQLNISQPALSSWLGTLERQLGTKLVIRSRKNLTLTPAGKLYLDGCRRMMKVKQRTYGEIAKILGNDRDVIVISGTPNGGASLFSQIFSPFRQRYPSVSLRFSESYNTQTIQAVLDGTADFGICSMQDLNSPLFEYVLVSQTELVLYLPADHKLAYDASLLMSDAELPVIRFSSLSDTPFIMPSPEMSYYNNLMQLFDSMDFHPAVLFQSANVKVLYQMVRDGNGAAILPRRLFSPLDPVSPFSLRPKFINFSAIIYKKGRQLTAPQSYAVELLSRSLFEN